jgi:1-pyrroline-5-carboxylate dehydrogenase
MQHVDDAINAALAAKEAWNALGWEQRAAIFLKAADLWQVLTEMSLMQLR